MLNKLIAYKNSILFFIAITIIILWQMLLPGFVLTLDMVFAPKINHFYTAGEFYNYLPLTIFLKFLNLGLSGWIIQKLLLFSLFFLIGFLAFVFLPIPKKYNAHYFAALFYMINPFVYERFLAGHWMILFGYAFLPPFFYYLMKFKENPVLKNSLLLYGSLFLINIFSIHIFTMSAIIAVVYFIINQSILVINNNDNRKAYFKNFVIGGLIFLLFSLYWLVPYFTLNQSSIINNFDASYWEAFRTAGSEKIPTVINVLTLHGFWAERHIWAGYFIWPQNNFSFWIITLLSLSIFIIAGTIKTIKYHKEQFVILFALGSFSLMFSSGLGDTVFKDLNLWLFNNIGFWSGFRDSQKWSAYLVLVYAILLGYGIIYISKIIEKRKLKLGMYFVQFLMVLAILNTYTMLGGFSRQLQPVWYPESWHKANAILNQDTDDFKVLFLPWHQYLSLRFNRFIITNNPAKRFFDKPIVQSQNMEMKGVVYKSKHETDASLNHMITNHLEGEENMKILKNNNIKYIIKTHDLDEADIYDYDFISQKEISPIFKSEELTLFKVISK